MNRPLVFSIATLLIMVGLVIPAVGVGQTNPESDAQPIAENAPLERPDTLVLCPPAFRDALQPWIDYRTTQDHQIRVQSPGRSAFEVRQQVLAAHRGQRLKHVVLIGDAPGPGSDPQRCVPTDYVMAQVNVRFGSEPEIATDNTYADVDRDGIPDLSIGRIPVDTAAQLRVFVDRLIRYEQNPAACECFRRINFIAGVGGFGGLIDNAIERAATQIITDLIPGSIDTSMTYASWKSPYCPDPRRFSESAIERFNEGCLFWVYIGHGSTDRLDRLRMPDREHEILESESVDRIQARHGQPIALFLSCYNSAIDATEDCLAERMLQREQGPIASIGGSRVTMPAAMGVLSLELLHEYFHGDTATIGELLMVAKQRMIRGSDHFRHYRQMIELMARTFNPGHLLKREKYEHVQLLHLLGDPLLRLPRPMAIHFGGPGQAVAGQPIRLTGKSPAEGSLTLELCYRRDRLQNDFAARRQFDATDAALANYQETYDSARDLVCQRIQLTVRRGLFTTTMNVPDSAHGPCVIRASLDAKDGFALGSTQLEILPPESIELPAAKAEKVAHRIEQPILDK